MVPSATAELIAKQARTAILGFSKKRNNMEDIAAAMRGELGLWTTVRWSNVYAILVVVL